MIESFRMSCQRTEYTLTLYSQSVNVFLSLYTKGDTMIKEREFTEMVRAWHPRFKAVTHTHGVKEDDVDDVLQETYLKVWSSRGQFKRDSKLSTFCFAVLRNEIRMYHRFRGSRKGQCMTFASEIPPALPTPEPRIDSVLELKEQLARLRPAIQEHPELLRKLEGDSLDSIAMLYGVSIPCIKGRLHRSRRDLKSLVIN